MSRQGVELWMSRLHHVFHAEFSTARSIPWKEHDTRIVSGTARAAGRGAGNVTFVRIYEAGYAFGGLVGFVAN